MASSVERRHIDLPVGFDPRKHQTRMEKVIAEKFGDGWEIESMDSSSIIVTRMVAITQVEAQADGDSMNVRLPRSTKPNDGEKVAAQMADAHPGFEMTQFDPYLGWAVLSRMAPTEIRARGVLATALGCKPWEVQVQTRKGGGFLVALPKTYVPSKHDGKLDEAATTSIGQPGWYLRTNAKDLTTEIIPAEPPTFPGAIPTPMPKQVAPFDHTNKDHFQIALGWELPDPGQKTHDIFSLNLDAGAHSQIVGTSGSGKSVTINCYIAQWLSRGAELVIIDLPAKSADFEWCKKYVRPGGWGCDGPDEAATAIELVMQEGQRRAKLIKEAGVTEWKDLPKGKGLKPLVVVVDELTGLYAMEKVPKTSKNSPPKLFEIAEEAERVNFAKELLKKGISRAAAELRFTGVFLLLATQMASVSTGIDTALRINLHQKILLGAKPTEGNRKLVFSDIERVPTVPDNVTNDPKASRGVGSIEPEGNVPTVFKSYFATVEQYLAWLDGLGVPVPGNPEPTRKQISDLMGEDTMVDQDAQREEMIERRRSMPDPVASIGGDADWDGKPLKGAALAAAQSAQLAALAKRKTVDA